MTRFHHPAFRLASAALFLLVSEVPSMAQPAAVAANEQRDQPEEKTDSQKPLLPAWAKRRLSRFEPTDAAPHGLAPAFGDIKRGSGFAPGAGYGQVLFGGGVIVLKGAYSVKNYKMVQMAAQSPPLAGHQLLFRGRARWQDAPSVRLYPLGSDSPDLHTQYGETKTEVSGEAAWSPASFVRVLAGIGLEQFDTSGAHDGNPPPFASAGALPGSAADPRYVHSQVTGALDGRDNPGYSRRGTLVSATFHNFHQTSSGPFTFQRVDAVAEQYIPLIPDKSAIFLNLHVATTMNESDHEVPFFLLPDLGGHDLRGFSDYRFRDRHAINWTAEYRWFPLDVLDAAIFYDAGKVASQRSALDFHGLESSIGAGIRLHSARTTYLRLEVARSREGFRFIIAFSPVGQ